MHHGAPAEMERSAGLGLASSQVRASGDERIFRVERLEYGKTLLYKISFKDKIFHYFFELYIR